MKLAAAYAAFANNGIYNKPYYVNKVVFNDGTSVDYQPDGKRAMKDSTAYMMTDMLKDVLNGGTGFNGAIPGLIQAAKTGTSNYTDEDLARMGTTEKELPRIVPLLVIQHTMPFLFDWIQRSKYTNLSRILWDCLGCLS